MELYQGIILGILQGLTEFLPVSSSGHLVLGQIFFGITHSQLAFDISLHVGTLLAVFVVYAADIRQIVGSVFSFLLKIFARQPALHLFKTDVNLKLAGMIVIGSVPTAAIGLGIKQFEDILFTSEILVGTMLLLTGTILWVSRKFYFSEARLDGVGMKQSLLIGVTQGLAVIPGISRSGSTIAAGMVLGLDRLTAAKFSFLLSIPAILGAEVLGVRDMLKQGMTVDSVTLFGTFASFVTGLAALKILLSLVHSGRFHLFAPYCWVAGSLVLFSKLM